jgi:hypothetical protein
LKIRIQPTNMNIKTILSAIAVIALGFTSHATVYSGNGNTSFGSGAIGNGSLTLTDDGSTVYGSLVVAGSGLGGNAFVLYVQAGAGGFSSTSGFNDNGDGNRTAISQYNGTGNQSILNFGSGGFTPNYAISLVPAGGANFGGLWQLTAGGGANSLPFVSTVNLSPTGSDGAGTYTFSFSLSSLGLTAGQSFNLFGLEVSTTGYSSAEAIGGTLTGANGYGNTQTVDTFSTYTTAVPEPSTLALGGLSALATLLAVRRRK